VAQIPGIRSVMPGQQEQEQASEGQPEQEQAEKPGPPEVPVLESLGLVQGQ
jgi:hypothetical protein